MHTLFLSTSGNAVIGIIAVGFLVFFVMVLILRWIFGIEKIVNNLEAQTRLMAYMAEKQGIDPSVIKEIMKDVK